jgi:hypothetical protein
MRAACVAGVSAAADLIGQDGIEIMGARKRRGIHVLANSGASSRWAAEHLSELLTQKEEAMNM